jgi:hypothetical protein
MENSPFYGEHLRTVNGIKTLPGLNKQEKNVLVDAETARFAHEYRMFTDYRYRVLSADERIGVIQEEIPDVAKAYPMIPVSIGYDTYSKSALYKYLLKMKTIPRIMHSSKYQLYAQREAEYVRVCWECSKPKWTQEESDEIYSNSYEKILKQLEEYADMQIAAEDQLRLEKSINIREKLETSLDNLSGLDGLSSLDGLSGLDGLDILKELERTAEEIYAKQVHGQAFKELLSRDGPSEEFSVEGPGLTVEARHQHENDLAFRAKKKELGIN